VGAMFKSLRKGTNHNLEKVETKLTRRAEYTFLDNLKRGRHRWLRLTPAYSARLVAEHLQHYPSSTRVLDPFGGTGTTALLAAQMGYPATLVEINPFLVWLSRAKTRIYTPDAIQSALEWGQMLVHKRRDYTHSACEPPPIRDIQRWWDAESLAWLTTMRTAIHATQATVAQASADLVWVAFAQCIIELGSFAQARPFRDIDIAVYLEPTFLQSVDPLRYCFHLADALERAVGYPVDVHRLNDAPCGFRFSATCGQALLSRDEAFRLEWTERTWHEYADFEPYRRMYLREWLRPFRELYEQYAEATDANRRTAR